MGAEQIVQCQKKVMAQFTIKDENHGDCKNSTSSQGKKKGVDSKNIGAGRIVHLP